MSQSPYYIYCDGYDKKPIKRKKNVLKLLSYDDKDEKSNIIYKLEKFESILINCKSTIGYDLVKIATYIYCADCQIDRGSFIDVYGEDWVRPLNFYIPVIEPDFWNRNDV